MTKKKTTKQIRAIDRIIKFQIDDGIESLTISGKEALADLEIDRNSNVTLYVNADKDKVNEINSLVPFVNVAVKETGTDPDKSKAVALSQDLTQFALELAEDSKQLAEIIKSETSLTIDFAQLITRLNDLRIAVDNAERTATQALTKAENAETTATQALTKTEEIERIQREQDQRLTAIEAKDQEQDNRLTVLKEKNDSQDERLNEIDVTQEAHAGKLASLEQKNQEQDNRLTVAETTATQALTKTEEIERIQQEQDGKIENYYDRAMEYVREKETHIINVENKNTEQEQRLTAIEAKDQEQDSRLTALENKEQGTRQVQVPFYNVSTKTLIHNISSNSVSQLMISMNKISGGLSFGQLIIGYNDSNVDTIPLMRTNNGASKYVISGIGYVYNVSYSEYQAGIYVVTVKPKDGINNLEGKIVLNSVLYNEIPDRNYEHQMYVDELIGVY